MEETALSPRPSTLAPPPLETAVSGTRALQRFDIGRLRAAPPDVADATEPLEEDEVEIIVTTAKMAVPAKIKRLGGTVKMAVPARIKDLRPVLLLQDEEEPRESAREQGPPVSLHDAAWALAASASFAFAGSLASAVIYVLLFP
jgi:hypothetical protein